MTILSYTSDICSFQLNFPSSFNHKLDFYQSPGYQPLINTGLGLLYHSFSSSFHRVKEIFDDCISANESFSVLRLYCKNFLVIFWGLFQIDTFEVNVLWAPWSFNFLGLFTISFSIKVNVPYVSFLHFVLPFITNTLVDLQDPYSYFSYHCNDSFHFFNDYLAEDIDLSSPVLLFP